VAKSFGGRKILVIFGTYFIGYRLSPGTIEQVLENTFIGRPPGNYDRLLNFSRPVTGNFFFVPSATFLDNVTADEFPRLDGSRIVRRCHQEPVGRGQRISGVTP
jgi:deferrochelatase/peroxidase EfeB